MTKDFISFLSAFYFFISITNLIKLCYTSCISFGSAALFYGRGLKELLNLFLCLLSASQIYFKILFMEFGVVCFAFCSPLF